MVAPYKVIKQGEPSETLGNTTEQSLCPYIHDMYVIHRHTCIKVCTARIKDTIFEVIMALDFEMDSVSREYLRA